MESSVIELLKPLTLEKENCTPIIFEAGTVLKVVMQTPTSLLVSNDDDFNFTIPLKDENELISNIIFFLTQNKKVWKDFLQYFLIYPSRNPQLFLPLSEVLNQSQYDVIDRENHAHTGFHTVLLSDLESTD